MPAHIKPLHWIGFAAAAAMVVGSFGPWLKASAGFISVSISGTDGANDGWLVVAAGIAGGLALLGVALNKGNGLSILGLLAGISGAVVTIYDRQNLSSKINDTEGVLAQVGWGLNLAMCASIVLAVVGLVAFVQGRSEPSVAPQLEPTE